MTQNRHLFRLLKVEECRRTFLCLFFSLFSFSSVPFCLSVFTFMLFGVSSVLFNFGKQIALNVQNFCCFIGAPLLS